MKKYYFLIIVALILGLVLTGCSLLSNIGQAPATDQSGITYLTKSIPPPDDLVGLWHFDDNSLDSSVNSNDGEVYEATYVDGKFGKALKFDGINDYVEVPYSDSMNVSGNYTFEAWIYLESEGTLGVSVYRGFFRRGTLGALASEIEIYTQRYIPTATPDGRLTVAHNRSGTFSYRYFTQFPLDQWVHLAVTWDGTTSKAYYNGIEQASTGLVMGSSAISNKPNFIGVGYYTAYMKGIIDEVRIWKVALLPNQLDFYGFNGLLPPYEETKAFKIGSSIPLKWQYTDAAGNVVDSSEAKPRVRITLVDEIPPQVTDDPILVDDSGNSGLRYDSTTYMWIFNWKTKVFEPGTYWIWITSAQTGQINGQFPIMLR